MAKKTRTRTRRGRPAPTGKGTLIRLRCTAPFLSAVDRWRNRQQDRPTRSAALVRLAEQGLSVSAAGRTSPAKASKAAALAADEIDRLTDRSATSDERATRKRHLLKGPKEFRDFRRDHPAK